MGPAWRRSASPGVESWRKSRALSSSRSVDMDRLFYRIRALAWVRTEPLPHHVHLVAVLPRRLGPDDVDLAEPLRELLPERGEVAAHERLRDERAAARQRL